MLGLLFRLPINNFNKFILHLKHFYLDLSQLGNFGKFHFSCSFLPTFYYFKHFKQLFSGSFISSVRVIWFLLLILTLWIQLMWLIFLYFLYCFLFCNILLKRRIFIFYSFNIWKASVGEAFLQGDFPLDSAGYQGLLLT